MQNGSKRKKNEKGIYKNSGLRRFLEQFNRKLYPAPPTRQGFLEEISYDPGPDLRRFWHLPLLQVRQQQLPAETLLYVLDCLDRNTLDQCVLVSSSHEKLVGRASPLRRVKTALLHRCAFKARQGYRALFSCHEVVREQQKCVSCTARCKAL